MAKSLSNFFEKYIEEDNIFEDKNVLHTTFMPESIEHRDEQLQQLADILAPALKSHKPSNVFVYGKTGTGKTLTTQHLTNEMQQVAEKRNVPLDVIYINCKLKRVADTEYRLIAEIARHFGKAIPPTGLPTDEVYKIFYSALEEKQQIVLLILDEIDQLVEKCGDEILYNLTRINTSISQSQIGIIGISNNILFTEQLDPRVVSSLSEEEIVFPPYNAIELRQILTRRANKAFKEDIVEQGVIEKCAAYAAKEHGDARRAIELLRIAGELAERETAASVNIGHLDKAESKIEKDKLLTLVSTQPKQHQLILYAVMAVVHDQKKDILTGQVYECYTKYAAQLGLRPLTQRRVSDIITEFDMLGLINASVISKGRFGRTREISLGIPMPLQDKVHVLLEQALGL